MIRIRCVLLNVLLAMFENGMLSGHQMGFLSSLLPKFRAAPRTVVNKLRINILNYKTYLVIFELSRIRFRNVFTLYAVISLSIFAVISISCAG